MTRIEDFVELNGQPVYWVLKNTISSRRSLFKEGDYLRFDLQGGLAELKVFVQHDTTNQQLGRRIKCRFNPNNEALVALNDHGRTMTFTLRDTGTRQLRYEAVYDEPPHDEPDESGDGEPKPR